MARPQVNPIAAPDLRPVASPVDTFAAPQAGEQVAQLADALKGLAPELAQFGSTIFQQNREADTKAGIAEANRLFQEIQDTGKQIKTGEIGAHESRWFRAAAQEQLGRLHAGKYASTLRAAMEDPNSPLATATDPAEFDHFAAQTLDQFRASTTDGQDAYFANAFNAGANEETLSLRNAFAAQAGQRLQTQVIEATYQEHQQTIEQGLREGLSMEDIGKRIYDRNTIQYALNPASGAALSNTMLRAVIDTARKTENLEVLDILKSIPGGAKGSTLSNTSLANKLVPEAEQQIRAARQQRYALNTTEDRNERNEQLETALGSLYDTMDAAQEGGQTVTEEQLRSLAQSVNPEDSARVYRAFDAYKKRTIKDDEAIAHGLWQKAFDGTLSNANVADAFENGDLTVETSRRMRDEIKKNRARKGAAKALTQQPLLQETKTRLRGLFIDQYGINAPEMRMRAELAVQDLENAWVAWRRGDGANADDAGISTWLQGQTTTIFSQRADVDLKDATSAVLPKNPSTGPQPVQWEKGLTVKPVVLQGLALHLANMKRIPNYKLPASYEDVLRRNGIKNLAEAEAFLKKQQSFIPQH